MHSYSFDISNEQSNLKNSKKYLLKLNDFKWANIILSIVLFIQLIFNLHMQLFSYLLNLILIFFPVYSFILIKKFHNEKDQISMKEHEVKIRKIYKIFNYFLFLCLIDLIMSLIFFRPRFLHYKKFEYYFSSLSVGFTVIRTLTLFINFYELQQLALQNEPDNKSEFTF
jgi:hypothetical protein